MIENIAYIHWNRCVFRVPIPDAPSMMHILLRRPYKASFPGPIITTTHEDPAMNQTFKKIISVFLAFLLILQVFPVTPVGFAAYTDHITIGDVTLDCYHTVSYDPQKNIYRLNLSLDAELYEQRSSNSSSIPLRNYFTANYTGDYLIQLWGGKGADGMDESDRLGGDGGAGGYVHGIVHLEKGQTLF